MIAMDKTVKSPMVSLQWESYNDTIDFQVIGTDLAQVNFGYFSATTIQNTLPSICHPQNKLKPRKVVNNLLVLWCVLCVTQPPLPSVDPAPRLSESEVVVSLLSLFYCDVQMPFQCTGVSIMCK